MKFEKLYGQNVLTLAGPFDIRLQDMGLHLIRGENEDDSSASSNGAGKSSVVDALCWCIYGVTARGAKGDAVVNRHAKKNALAGVVINNGASRYIIERYRKDALHKNALRLRLINADPTLPSTDLSKGTDAETQKLVEEFMGCSYEVFVAAVYSGQEIMPDLPRMTDRQLKSLIEEAAGMQRIELAYEVARSRMNDAKSAVALIESTVNSLRGQVSNAEIAVGNFTNQSTAWHAGKAARVKSANDTLGTAIAQVAALTIDSESLQRLYDMAVPHIASIDAKLADHKRFVDLDEAAQKRATAAERALNVHAIQQAQARVAEIQGFMADPDKYGLQPCKECGTVRESMTREDYLTHRQKHLDEASAKFAELRTLAMAQKQVIDAARAERVMTYTAIPDVSALTAQRAKLMTTKEVLDRSKVALSDATTVMNKVRSDKAKEETAVDPYEAGLLVSEHQLESGMKALDEATKTSLVRHQEFQIANEVVKLFGPAGMRAQILDTVTPYLNSRTSEYLSVLSDGLITATWTTLSKSSTGELKEKFSIEVSHERGGEDFVLISGGEKRKVRIACALALQDLVASRATQPIDLWIGDEIDDALDPAGLERLMTILERKARERGTVLVISHSDLRDWIDNVTTVRKHAQFQSKVEGSLCI